MQAVSLDTMYTTIALALCQHFFHEKTWKGNIVSSTIRVRAAIVVIQDGKILLVPHYNTNESPISWHLPGGGVEFGEAVQEAAIREFREETGLYVRIESLLDINEVIQPERPYHSITTIFSGSIIGGTLTAESGHPYMRYGDKMPRWFSWEELQVVKYLPEKIIATAFTNGRPQSPPLRGA